MQEEKIIWKGHPSHIKNFSLYFICLITCCLVVPLLIALWQYIKLACWRIEVTNQRIITSKGVFSKDTEELELYRVKDISLQQPFFLRLFGLSNVVLVTSDKTTKEEVIPAVKNGRWLKEELRKAVDERRDLKRVREFDDNI